MITAQKAPAFVSLEKSRTAYERASQALPALKENLLDPFKGLVYAAAGLDPYQMGKDIVQVPVPVGDIRFGFQVERRIQNPAYQAVVEGWQDYVRGVNLLAQERTITGIIKRDGKHYVAADTLLDEFLIKTYGKLKVCLEFNMNKHDGVSELEQIVVPDSADAVQLTTAFGNAYWNGLQMVDSMEALVKAYAKAVKRESETTGEKRVAVTKTTAYEPNAVKSERANWAGVVKTLVQVPTDRNDEEKELEALADDSVSLRERVDEFGDRYDLVRHTPYGEVKLYVGLNSVHARIEDLKSDTTVSERISAKPREQMRPRKR